MDTTNQTCDKQTAAASRKRNSNHNGNGTVVTSATNLIDSYQNDYQQQQQQQPASPASSCTSQTTGDTTFEPSIDMMVNDFDDEQTLTEEEALAELEAQDPADEISTLQKESEIPLEELLAHYRQHVEQDYQQRRQKKKKSNKKKWRTKKQSKRNSSNIPPKTTATETGNLLPVAGIDEVIVIEESDDEVEVFKTEQADTDNGEDCLISDTQSNYHQVCEDEEDADDEGADLCEEDEIETDNLFSGKTIDFSKRSHLLELYPEKFSTVQHKLDNDFSDEDDDDDEDDDEDDDDDDDDSDYAKRTIMVGSTYQATIPVGLSKYGDVLPYENEDKLIWEPSQVSEQEVEEYLMRVKEIKSSSSTTQDEEIPSSSASVTSESDQGLGSSLVKDDEQALHLLVQCGYNFKEALRRNRLNAVPLTGSMSLWSEEECRNFEDGIQKFGKDFRKIRQNQVRTRSIRELVQFYYLWKKTDRRDQDFIDSDTIDHMDQYLDFDERDTGSNGGAKHVSSSLSSENLGSNAVFMTKKLGASTSSVIKNFSILNEEKHIVTCSSTSKKSSGSKKSSNDSQTTYSNDVPVYRRRNSLLTTNKPHHLDNNSIFITKCSAETSSQVTGKIWRTNHSNPSTASAAITSTTGNQCGKNK